MNEVDLARVLRRLNELRQEFNNAGYTQRETKMTNWVIDFIEKDFKEVFGAVIVVTSSNSSCEELHK